MSYYRYGRGRPDPSGGYYSSRWTPGVKGLLIANGVLFLAQLMVGRPFTVLFGLVPDYVTHRLFLWQLLTYMFLHGGFFHLLFNMFVLWMFGCEVEGLWGRREFLKYYFLTGVGAGILTVISSPNSFIPTVGASGAIYGLLLAFGLLFPERYIYLYFLIPVKAKYLVVIFGAVEFLAAFSGRPSGIAHFAHLGGILVGLVYLKRGVIRNKLFGGVGRKERRRYSTRRESGDDMGSQVDRILRKISQQGMNSLTTEERETLDRASRSHQEPETEE